MKTRTGVAVIAGVCITVMTGGHVNFNLPDAPGRSAPLIREGMELRLAADARQASDKAERHQRAVRRCRFEIPGATDRILTRPDTDPPVAACLAHSAA